MTRKRSRELDRQERLLWETVARTVTPLPGRTQLVAPVDPPPADQIDSSSSQSQETTSGPARKTRGRRDSPAGKLAQTLPPMVVMARKERRAVVRGVAQIDAKLDLHGVRQDEAQHILRAFLLRSAAAGCRTVLVVTGKGAPARDDAPLWHGDRSERGVLRRLAPFILESTELRDIVLGYEAADQRHGGLGALYVRLRRRSR
ncbi:Smr/MutS family protein [Camelimonas sp. ID_303_24]